MNIERLRHEGVDEAKEKDNIKKTNETLVSRIRSLFSENNVNKRMIKRCQCGELWWEDSPQKILARHDGHKSTPAMGGSFWEFLKLKAGLIR